MVITGTNRLPHFLRRVILIGETAEKIPTSVCLDSMASDWATKRLRSVAALATYQFCSAERRALSTDGKPSHLHCRTNYSCRLITAN
jgi:hypothetical protein